MTGEISDESLTTTQKLIVAEELVRVLSRELADLRQKIASMAVGRGSWCFDGEWAPGAIGVVELAEIVGFDVPPAPSVELTEAEIQALRQELTEIRRVTGQEYPTAPDAGQRRAAQDADRAANPWMQGRWAR